MTPLITYDALGRAVRVDLPNGSVRRVEFDPWRSVTWDENDTSAEALAALDSPSAAQSAMFGAAAEHVDTPTVVLFDVQGRPFRTREFLEAVTTADYDSGPSTSGVAVVTSLTLDVVGNPTVVTDARSIAIQTQSFDLLGRPYKTASPDGGDLNVLLDVHGQVRFTWKSGSVALEREYDALRRPVRAWEWSASGTPSKVLRERVVYGEALATGSYEPADDNRRGRAVRVYDEAGLTESEFDWKGRVTALTRTFLADEEGEGDWTTAAEAAAYPFAGDTSTDVSDLEADAAAELEGESFETGSTYDALDRVVESTAPDGQVVENSYDDGGRLYAVSMTTADAEVREVVTAITYNARGQRESIAYGNGAVTTYEYDADTLRLYRLYTVGDPDGDAASDAIQDLVYAYDPVGNIVEIVNAAEDTLYHDNAAVSPDQSFAYDALYRLTEATGRERTDREALGFELPSAGALPCAETKRSYAESYSYDAVGNITAMVHTAGGGTAWSRAYTYASDSNRLESAVRTSATSATLNETYVHDSRGNMVYLPTLLASSGGSTPNITASSRDQMIKALLPTSGHEAFYHYDAGGQRVRKVVKTGTHSERRYVGSWEVYREYDGAAVKEERTSLSVFDGQSRVLLVETKTRTEGEDETELAPVLRYQLGNHLGTVAVELDEEGGLISYEEYLPYGATAWWAGHAELVSQKRHRFTGMERDEESGLQCHGVRYYAGWLGRWTSDGRRRQHHH